MIKEEFSVSKLIKKSFEFERLKNMLLNEDQLNLFNSIPIKPNNYKKVKEK